MVYNYLVESYKDNARFLALNWRKKMGNVKSKNPVPKIAVLKTAVLQPGGDRAMKKRAFLLSGVPQITLTVPTDCYNPELEMNTVIQDGVNVPFVLNGSDPTESKTFRRPADDDPDPDDERCY